MPEIRMEQLSVSRSGKKIIKGIDFTWLPGQSWAVTGSSGAGKTSFAMTLAGQLPFSGSLSFQRKDTNEPVRIKLVEQQHHFRNLSNTIDLYYQQRYNSMDAEDSETVEQYLQHQDGYSAPEAEKLLKELEITALLKKPLIQLSNGENKRLQLAIALFGDPDILVFDNPFTGLDTKGRSILDAILHQLQQRGMQLMLICSVRDIPSWISHVMLLGEGDLKFAGTRTEFMTWAPAEKQEALVLQWNWLPADMLRESDEFTSVIRMKNVRVVYGEKIILDGINWEVRKGERWAVTGSNGSGKSTLLSLVYGDNPQAYANDIHLFDRKRGSGESIWDIKRKIGFVSPELHLYFDRSSTCYDVLASGLFDTIGLFRILSSEQEEQVNQLFELFGMKEYQHRLLFQLSLGQQRLLLLARAIIKRPPLLLLDEPGQGLDEEQLLHFNELVNGLCLHSSTSLVYVSHYEEDVPACVTKWLRL